MQNPSFHRAVLDASRSVTLVIGIDGSVMFASRGVQDILGYPATWAEGRNILDYIHPEDVSRVVESLALADDNREIRYIPMTILIRDNEENWVEIDIVSSNRLSDPEISGIIVNIQTAECRPAYSDPITAMAKNESHARVMQLIAQGVGRGGHVRRPSFFVPIDAAADSELNCSMPDHPISEHFKPEIFKLFVAEPIDKVDVSEAGELLSVNRSELPVSTLKLMDRWDIAGIRFAVIAPNDTPHEVTHYLVSLDYALPETLWMDGIWSPTGVQQWQELMQYAGIALSHERNRIKLQRAASRDTLTDLFNRSEFVKELTRQNLGTEGSGVLFIDLDDFKAINDRYGHNIGDIALVTIAQNILKALPEQGVACRMGGDEFVIVTPNSIDARALAESLITSCAEPFTTEPEPLTVSASIGVAQIREDETLEHAIQRADIALMQAKQEGKHRLVSCD